MDLGEVLSERSKGERTKVWRVQELGPESRGDKGPYLSVNAHTIEADQGLDLRELTEKKLVEYIDCRNERGQRRYDYPHHGGSF